MITGPQIRIELIDRGDPAAYDLTQAAMTMNNTWQNWDLSAIVPAQASWVLLRVQISDPNVGENLYFRKDGNVNAIGTPGIVAQAANITNNQEILVPCSAGRVIEYKAGAVFGVINIVVLGWISGTVIPAVPAGMYKVLYESDVLVNNTGDALENDMVAVNIPGGLLGENGGIRITACGRNSGNAGTKTWRLKLGGVTEVTVVVAADPAAKDWRWEATIHNQGHIANEQNWTHIFFDELAILQQAVDDTSGRDMSGDLELKMTAQNANGADWAQLFHITIEVFSA